MVTMLVRFGSKYSSYVVFEDAGLIGSPLSTTVTPEPSAPEA